MKKIIGLSLIALFIFPLSSFAFLSKDKVSAINSIKKANIETELSSVSLGQLALEREESANLIKVGNYKFSVTLIIDNNWDIYFALWPKDSSMDSKTLWLAAEIENGVVYEHKGIKFNLVLENSNIVVNYEKDGSEFTSKISYDDIFHRLYFNAEKIVFADMVEYSLIRNHDPLNDKDGIITLRIDRDGMFWYSFNLDEIISNQTKWLVGINSVLYGMRIRDNNLVFFSKPIDIGKIIYRKEKLLNY